jgi:uncharacterized membrane protein
MSAPRPGWSDQQVEQTIGNLLRIGLLAATALVIVGAAIYLRNHGSEAPDYRIFRGEPPDLRGLSGIIGLVLDWRGRGFIQFGLLILLATPVARVAFSIVAFALQRDAMYVGITVLVLIVLLYSIVGGYV